jgi:hypothetical protein
VFQRSQQTGQVFFPACQESDHAAARLAGPRSGVPSLALLGLQIILLVVIEHLRAGQ